MFSVGAKAGISHPIRMPDDAFLLPVPGDKPTDFSGAIVRGCHKVFSVGAEAGISHPIRMLDDGYFLPLAVSKSVDFGEVIV